MPDSNSSISILKVVGAAIVRGKSCLVAQRSLRMSEPGKWEFPGGKIELGERPDEALRREIREELDLEIEVGPLLGHGTSVSGSREIHLQVHIAYPLTSRVRLSEHQRYLWCRADELLHLDWTTADLPVIPALICWLSKKTSTTST